MRFSFATVFEPKNIAAFLGSLTGLALTSLWVLSRFLAPIYLQDKDSFAFKDDYLGEVEINFDLLVSGAPIWLPVMYAADAEIPIHQGWIFMSVSGRGREVCRKNSNSAFNSSAVTFPRLILL